MDLHKKKFYTHTNFKLFSICLGPTEINDGDQQMDDKRIPDGLGSPNDQLTTAVVLKREPEARACIRDSL